MDVRTSCLRKAKFESYNSQYSRRLALGGPRRFRFVEIVDNDVQFFSFARMRYRWFPGWLFPDIYGLRSRFLAGEVSIDEMLPRHLPVQVIRIDRLALVGIAGEPTRVAGLRVQKSVGQTLEQLGVKHVVVNGYANAYSGYVVTEHEYAGRGLQYAGVNGRGGRRGAPLALRSRGGR